MAKGETKKTNRMLEEQRRKQEQTYQPFVQAAQQRGTEAYGRTSQLYGDLYGAYSQLAQGGGLAGAGSYGGAAVKAPNYALTNFAPTRPTYEEFQKTGGVDVNRLRAGTPTLEELSNTAGLDPTAIARFRGAGVYDEFARTGGFSEGDIRNIRARTASAVPAFYGGLRAEMGRAGRIGGAGGTAARNATALRLARERSKAQAEAVLAGELGLSESIREGRLAGAGGVAGTEASLQGYRGATRAGAATSLADIAAREQGMIQSGRMWGTAGVGDIESTIAAERNRQIEANAAAARSNAGRAASDAAYRDRMRMMGLEGLAGLRGEEMGAQQLYGGQFLQGAGSHYGLGNEQLSMRYNAPGNQPFDWGGLISAGVGAAGAFLPGAGPALAGAGGMIAPKKWKIKRVPGLPGGG